MVRCWPALRCSTLTKKRRSKTMKYTLTTNEAVRLLMQDENANWSREGAEALIEYLDEIDPDMEFCCVAIRCDFAEYSSASEAAEDLFRENFDPEEQEDAALKFLDRNDVLVAEFNGGVIVRNA